MSSLASSERRRLGATALEAGPDAPTLCQGWQVRDLLAHLVVRDSAPLAGAGIVLPPLAFLTERAMRKQATREFATLVAQVQHPAPWAPARLAPLDRALNTLEYFVHHEDIRRARPGWKPRELTSGEQQQLWRGLRVAGRGLVRRAGTPVTLRWEETGLETTLRKGDDAVVLTGDPGELALFLFGRDQTTGLAFDGPDAAVTRLREEDLGV